MPYKNDDLNKLFQKAARNYPLNTDNSNWDDVATKLDNAAAIEAGRKNKWKYPVILLLFTISSTILYKIQSDHNQAKKQQVTGNKISEQIVVTKSGQPQNNVHTISEDLKITETKRTVLGDRDLSIAKVGKVAGADDDFSGNALIKTSLFNLNNLIVTESKKQTGKVMNSDIEDLIVKSGREVAIANRLNENVENVSAKEKRSLEIQLKPAYRIYGVLYGGAKLSAVKFQQIEKPGYRMGVGIGYKISNHFNLELGLQREHLNFYTDGRYIDTAMLRIKSNKEIESVSAGSKITSVPLTLQYHFSSKGRGHFFVSAGTNAVVITHSEKYNYSVSKGGVENKLSKSYSALRDPKYFSGVNVSAGYETKLCRLWSVKVEPYYQTPVHDFGVGRVPATNFGIDVGIIRDLK